MAEKVKLSKDGSSIDFVQSDSLPTSMKKFRQSPEIEGFYRFIFENDLQKEAFEILDRIVTERKRKKSEEKAREKAIAKELVQKEKEALKAAAAAKAAQQSAKAAVKAPKGAGKVGAKALPTPAKKLAGKKPVKASPAPKAKAAGKAKASKGKKK